MRAIDKLTKKEILFDAVALIYLLFVFTNASVALGTAYQFFVYASIFFLFVNMFIDKNVRVSFQKKDGGTIMSIIHGFLGWVVLLGISYFILRMFDPVSASLGSIINSFGAANPVFSNSKIINFLTISFAIGYAETMLWSRGAEFICDTLKIPISKKTKFAINYIFLSIVLSVFFAIFHLTSKGVGATSSLLIVGVMMFISMIMIALFNGETRQAVWMHIIANSAAAILILLKGGTFFV